MKKLEIPQCRIAYADGSVRRTALSVRLRETTLDWMEKAIAKSSRLC